VAHACNPSCSGGRNQEDQNSKRAWANYYYYNNNYYNYYYYLRNPILKNPNKKRAGGVYQGVGPEFKPQSHQKKKKKKKRKSQAIKRWQMTKFRK
jgi:hypothetical protein